MEHVRVDGEAVPALGLGTYRLRGQECVHVVREALELGYRHVDTAEMYDNHAEVGEAIAESSVDREEVFLTTKVWRTNLKRTQVLTAVEESLEALGTAYVDLLLVHWPNERVPVAETLGAMNRLQREGKVRHVGVSNFSVAQLEEAREASETRILTDQVEFNPYSRDADLLAHCLKGEVALTAYSPLAKGDVADDPTLAEIGERYGKTPAQVALRWLLDVGAVAIPKTSSRDRLRENLEVFDFGLTDDEVERVFDLGGGLPDDLRDALGLAG